MGVAAEEPVVALEAAAQRPAVVRSRRRDLIRRRQVPLAEGIGVVAFLEQDLRQHAVLERDVAVAAGVSGGAFGDARHRVRVMIPAGQHAAPGRRAERRGVHVVEEQSVGSERIDVRRLDRAAIAPHLAKAGVVLHDEQHVGGACLRSQRLGPRGLRDIEGPTNHAGERGPGFVLFQRHFLSLLTAAIAADPVFLNAPVLPRTAPRARRSPWTAEAPLWNGWQFGIQRNGHARRSDSAVFRRKVVIPKAGALRHWFWSRNAVTRATVAGHRLLRSRF